MAVEALKPSDVEKLREVDRLNLIDDPDSEPYKSKYKARKLLKDVHEKMANIMNLPESHRLFQEFVLFYCVRGVVEYKLGLNHIETEERGNGEKWLQSSKETLSSLALTEEACGLYLSTLNQLGFVNAEFSDNDKAKACLTEAEATYAMYKALKGYRAPWDTSTLYEQLEKMVTVPANDVEEKSFTLDMSCSQEELLKKFEQLFTYTLYFLAQVYKNKGENSLAAKYCQSTLDRQLKDGSYDPFDWALNCATLSQHYISGSDENLLQARHCLASAQAIVELEEHKLSASHNEQEQGESDTNSENVSDKIKRCKADIFRCWAKYGLAVLQLSKEVLTSADDIDQALAVAAEQNDTTNQSIEDTILRFSSLNLSDLENIPSCHITEFSQAREVFLKVLHWLEQAKLYYTVDSYCSDYVQIIQDCSLAYKLLAFFEPLPDRKAKMHRRRLDLISDLLKQLNKDYYLAICRQLMFEGGEISNELLNIKLDTLDEAFEGRIQNSHQLTKINYLANEGIKHFRLFLETFRTPDGVMPNTFPADCLRPVVLAHFYLARLYNKILTADPKEKCSYVQLSLLEYQWIVNYCNRNDVEGVETVRSELDACSEMVVLLPVKLARLCEQLA